MVFLIFLINLVGKSLLQSRRLWGQLIAAFPRDIENKTRIVTFMENSDRTRGNGFKLKQERFKLAVGQELFM